MLPDLGQQLLCRRSPIHSRLLQHLYVSSCHLLPRVSIIGAPSSLKRCRTAPVFATRIWAYLFPLACAMDGHDLLSRLRAEHYDDGSYCLSHLAPGEFESRIPSHKVISLTQQTGARTAKLGQSACALPGDQRVSFPSFASLSNLL